MLPNSQRRGSVLPSSHKTTARKAFEQITKKMLPASHAQLERALRSEASAHAKRVDAIKHPKRAAAASKGAVKEGGTNRQLASVGGRRRAPVRRSRVRGPMCRRC